MAEKKKYFTMFISLFAFLFFVSVGTSYACPIKWNAREIFESLCAIPAYNNPIIAANELSNLTDLNNDETESTYSDLVYDLDPDGSYEVLPPDGGESGASPVPEPATIILMGSGLISMLFRKMKRGG